MIAIYKIKKIFSRHIDSFFKDMKIICNNCFESLLVITLKIQMVKKIMQNIFGLLFCYMIF